MKLWKALGLAGLAGVAATGVIIARDQRRRAELTPEDIRCRLQERLEAAASEAAVSPPAAPPARGTAGRHALPRIDLWRRVRGA
jgi:hypothetical protein